MKSRPIHAVIRSLVFTALFVYMGACFTTAHAQNTLVVSAAGAYTTIEAALADATTGDTIEVHGGVYPAPLVIDKTVTLIGIDQPVIDGGGEGSLVLINAPEVVFSGFVVRGSGASLTHEDTGIIIQGAHVTVSNNLLEDVLFGIYFANASGGIARDNVINAKPIDESMRGDGIRVWYSNDVQLISNEIIHGRDTLIWYADNITIRDNNIHDNRYGLHFMYNENAVVENNIIENNTVGAYMMYSAGLVMTGNQYINNRGASGYGIALKDMDRARVTDNAFIGNVVAIYLDNSPSIVDVYNTISNNYIAYNDVGLMGLPSVQRNIFQNNSFVENHQQVSVHGRGNLLGNLWSADGIGNYWSSYVGYDGDNDGIGDMPFRAERLFESLADSEPALRLFLFSPASQAIDFAASAFPSLRPDPKAIDDAPLMHLDPPVGMTQTTQGISVPLLGAALTLLLVGTAVCVLTLRGSQHPSVQKTRTVVQSSEGIS